MPLGVPDEAQYMDEGPSIPATEVATGTVAPAGPLAGTAGGRKGSPQRVAPGRAPEPDGRLCGYALAQTGPDPPPRVAPYDVQATPQLPDCRRRRRCGDALQNRLEGSPLGPWADQVKRLGAKAGNGTRAAVVVPGPQIPGVAQVGAMRDLAQILRGLGAGSVRQDSIRPRFKKSQAFASRKVVTELGQSASGGTLQDVFGVVGAAAASVAAIPFDSAESPGGGGPPALLPAGAPEAEIEPFRPQVGRQVAAVDLECFRSSPKPLPPGFEDISMNSTVALERGDIDASQLPRVCLGDTVGTRRCKPRTLMGHSICGHCKAGPQGWPWTSDPPAPWSAHPFGSVATWESALAARMWQASSCSPAKMQANHGGFRVVYDEALTFPHFRDAEGQLPGGKTAVEAIAGGSIVKPGRWLAQTMCTGKQTVHTGTFTGSPGESAHLNGVRALGGEAMDGRILGVELSSLHEEELPPSCTTRSVCRSAVGDRKPTEKYTESLEQPGMPPGGAAGCETPLYRSPTN
eukprot:gene5417-biopygen8744